MSKYRVGIYEEQSGYVIVEAKNAEEAKAKINRKLNENGIVAFDDFDVKNRETGIINKPEIC